MIPSADELVDGYPFVARRYGRVNHCDRDAIAAALAHADRLAAGEPSAEVSALLFAFASSRRSFPFAWRVMPAVLAFNHARATGRILAATLPDVAAVCIEVLHRRMDYGAVHAWVLERLR